MQALQQKVQSREPSITLKTEIIEATSASTADHILTYTDTQNIDLIVMASHGLSGLQRFLFGSVTERVMRAASCPVLVVKAPEQTQPGDEASEARDEEHRIAITAEE